MTTAQFQSEWDKRCEQAVIRDINAFRKRRYESLSDFNKHEHDRLVAESGHKVDRLVARLMNERGMDVDAAEDLAIEVVERELEREFDVRGYNDNVR